MRRFLTVLTAAVAVVAFSSMVFAQAPTQTKTEKKAEKAATKAEPESATGKVAKVDEAAKTFTVTTKSGDKDFTLAADAKITAGTKTEKVADLTGKNVKVTYTVVSGKNVASKVTVASEAKPEAGKKVEKK